MSTKFEVCRPSHSEVCQLSIYNSFPVIRTTIAKNRHFYVPGLRFLFALGTPLRQSRKTLHYFSLVAWWFCFVHIRKFIGGKS